jgi:tripeptidyl-peptidase-1
MSFEHIFPFAKLRCLGKENCGTVRPANVISSSYGYNEADLTPFYTARQCAEYAKLGLMGVTVLFSSGDNGVAGNGGTCLTRNGSESAQGKRFNPTFPSTCPYVTSVGATQGTESFSPYARWCVFISLVFSVNPGSSVFDPESACEQYIYSSGGFSNYFATPDYQKDAVQEYMENHRPPYSKTTYNSTGMSRGFPDLSANGANYVVSVSHSHRCLLRGFLGDTYVPHRLTAIFRSYTVHQPVLRLLEPS